MKQKKPHFNKAYPYEFLNKHELANLEERGDVKTDQEHKSFKCDCGCKEFIELRAGFGECRECKTPYLVEDRWKKRVYTLAR
jgi:hypothetical protein